MIIYKITNKVNNKIYIGCTILSLVQRFNAHYWKRYEGDTALKRALAKYGKKAFIITELDTANSRNEMLGKEKYWIKFLNTKNKEIGYNLHEGGFCLGRKATIDEKEANRRRNIGKPCLPETREKISLAQKGIPRSREAAEKARLKNIGRKQTKEHIEKCRLTRIGKKHSKEHIEKIRMSNLGLKRSEQTKLRVSAAQKKYHSENKNKFGEHIICLTNNKVYFSHQQAASALDIGRNGITRNVNGLLRQTHGYRFQKLTADHLIF